MRDIVLEEFKLVPVGYLDMRGRGGRGNLAIGCVLRTRLSSEEGDRVSQDGADMSCVCFAGRRIRMGPS